MINISGVNPIFFSGGGGKILSLAGRGEAKGSKPARARFFGRAYSVSIDYGRP